MILRLRRLALVVTLALATAAGQGVAADPRLSVTPERLLAVAAADEALAGFYRQRGGAPLWAQIGRAHV